MVEKGGTAGDQRSTISFYALRFLFFSHNYHGQVNYIMGDIRKICSLFLYSVANLQAVFSFGMLFPLCFLLSPVLG